MLDFPVGCGMLIFMFRRFRLLLLLLALLGCGTAKATTFLTLQSTYLGNGWFQYQMNVMDDPFFNMVYISDLGINFTNQIDQSTTSTNYTFDSTNSVSGFSDWTFTNWPPAVRPYTETFLLRSSNTSWKIGTNNPSTPWGAIILGSLGWNSFAPDNGAVFFAKMSCLIPCDAADADGSPTNYLFVLKLMDDVNINQLIQTNGNIYGVDFTWGYNSTFVVQGSMDLNSWTNIIYIWSYPPETAWTTNTPLNNYGQFFRVELLADGHATNLPPLTSALAFPSKTKASVSPTTPRVTGSQFVNGKFLVHVATQSDEIVLVQVVNSHGTICQSQQVTAKGTLATATFDVDNLPNPVFFNTVAVQ
jgi:hypothetical protein